MTNLQLSSDGITKNSKLPEKSNFVQTCNLLSQYLKEKRVKDLNLGITDNSEAEETTTKDLLTNIGKPSAQTMEQDQISMEDDTTNRSREEEMVMNEASTSKEVPKELKAGQLTIFYGGKVVVFDEYPADKARAVMLLASKGSPQSSCGVFQTITTNNQTNPSLNRTYDSANKPISISAAPQVQQPQSQITIANIADLPIARRSSVHRFLEKRKDRASGRAPYQVHNQLPSSSNREESSPKTHEGQIDLNFKL